MLLLKIVLALLRQIYVLDIDQCGCDIKNSCLQVFSLPNLRPQNKFKLTAHEGAKVRKVNFVNFRSRADENYTENDLVVLSNSGDVHVFTIPHLRRQMKTNVISKENVR